MAQATLEERFWARVQKTETCWLWTGGTTAGGYGTFGPRHGEHALTHRFAYELLIGPIPAGLTLDHQCHNQDRSCAGGPTCQHRRCCNPAHLEPATMGENTRRGEGPSAINARKTHCPRGHAYDEANTIHGPDGGRACKACGRARWYEGDRIAKRRQLRAAQRLDPNSALSRSRKPCIRCGGPKEPGERRKLCVACKGH